MDSDEGYELVLYHFPSSYFSQRVVIMLHEKELQYRSIMIRPQCMEGYQSWFLNLSPKGEVPVLKDGIKVVPDSKRILEYLDDNFTDSKRLTAREEPCPEVKHKINHFCCLVDSIPIFLLTFGTLFHTELVINSKPPYSIPFFIKQRKNHVLKDRVEHIKNVLSQPDLPIGVQLALVEKLEKLTSDGQRLTDSREFMTIIDGVANVLDQVEIELKKPDNDSQTNWLCSQYFTIADIYLAVLLHRINMIGLDTYFWKEGKRPSVETYYHRVVGRKSVQSAIKLPSFQLKNMDLAFKFTCYGLFSVAIGFILTGWYFVKRR